MIMTGKSKEVYSNRKHSINLLVKKEYISLIIEMQASTLDDSLTTALLLSIPNPFEIESFDSVLVHNSIHASNVVN